MSKASLEKTMLVSLETLALGAISVSFHQSPPGTPLQLNKLDLLLIVARENIDQGEP